MGSNPQKVGLIRGELEVSDFKLQGFCCTELLIHKYIISFHGFPNTFKQRRENYCV